MINALPDSFVRPATVSDVPTIGAMHAETMLSSLAGALGHDVPDAVRQQVTGEALAQGWAQAITAPPTNDHRVLTAMEGAQIVGFAAYAPADQQVVGEGADDKVVEILALEVPQAHGRKGHGSRLLQAIVDLTKGATEIQTWIAVGDEARTRFFHGAGFGPRGMRRTIAIGDEEITEQSWYAVL